MLCTVVHSNLNIILVATKVHMILRRFVVLTWMHDMKKNNSFDKTNVK